MQCPESKQHILSQWSRGKQDTRRLIPDPDASLNKLRESLDEVEVKYRNAMVSFTQLSNEKSNLEYQVDNLKDVIGEMEEKLLQNQTENKINSKELKILQTKLEECIKSVRCRDELLWKHGIVPEDVSSCDITQGLMTGVINTASAAQLAGSGGRGENKNQKDQLKYKDRTTLEQNVVWLQQQVTRYKSAAENARKAEELVKMEKRKLQRELRTAMNRTEEMEIKNRHLLKRLEKIKGVTSQYKHPNIIL